MQTQLAIDCSATGLSLALRTTTGQVFSIASSVARSSDLLPTSLASLFAQSETAAANLSHIFVTVGPGSFTGIRLGLATAEALRLVNPAITITGFSTLHALALQISHALQPAEAFTLALDAAGGQVYTQAFTPNAQPLAEAACIPAQTLTGNLVFADSSLLLPAKPLPQLNAEILFQLAESPATHLPPHPVYLKPLTYKKNGE